MREILEDEVNLVGGGCPGGWPESEWPWDILGDVYKLPTPL